MAISGKVRKIVAEDINFGTEQVIIERADGTTVNANQVNASHIPTSDGRNIDSIVKAVGYSLSEFDGLADAVAKIGNKDATLVIDKEVKLNQDLTIPKNITLKFLREGLITVNDGYTLTINCAIEAGLWQIFDGDGIITGDPKIDAVYPEWFGAKGDGINDDTDALKKAFRFKNIYCKGSYSYSSEIYLYGNLFGGVFIPKVETNSAIIIDSKQGIQIKNVSIKGSSENRYSIQTSCGLVVRNSFNVKIEKSSIDGVGGAGIFVFESRNIKINYNNVSNTKADGIHITKGSQEIFVDENFVSEVGDDGIAVVSYIGDGVICKDIFISKNYVSNNNARGISVVGGENIKICENTVMNSYASNIYIASEVSYNTYNCKDILVSGNYCDTFISTEYGGLIQVSDGNSQGIHNVKIVDNTLRNSPRSGIVLINNDVDLAIINGNYIDKVNEDGISIINCGSVSITNNTILNSGHYGVFVGKAVEFANVSFNVIKNSNLLDTSYVDSINIASEYAIVECNMTNSPNAERSIECPAKAVIRNNINIDLKPILAVSDNIINEKTRKIVVLEEQPTSGVWNAGDICLKGSPFEDGNNMILYGWICVQSGDFAVPDKNPVFKPLYISTVSPAK